MLKESILTVKLTPIIEYRQDNSLPNTQCPKFIQVGLLYVNQIHDRNHNFGIEPK